MAIDTETRSVHSFHINIGVGDCSIHLLVDDSDKTKKPIVYRAVLIDGGEIGLDVNSIIKNAIASIEASYDFKTVTSFRKSLRFDAIMVTHWDIDHVRMNLHSFLEMWGGIRTLLKLSLQDQIGNHPTIKAARDNSTATSDRVSQFKESVASFQCKYFKYADPEPLPSANPIFLPKTDTTPTPAIDVEKLLTTFYCPYMGGGPKPAVTDVGPATSDYKSTAQAGPFFISNDSKPYIEGDGQVLSIRVFYSYDKPAGARGTLEKCFRLIGLCRLRARYNDYLGFELFSSTAPTGTAPSRHQGLTNPGKLISTFKLKKTSGPRLFVVAGDQQVVGKQPLAVRTTPEFPDTPIRIVLPHGFVPPRVDVVDVSDVGVKTNMERKGSKQMNSPSIVLLLLSSTTNDLESISDANEKDAFEVLHYMAGDALWDVEGAVAAWLSKKGDPPYSAFMKLSHHGASDSSPVELFDTLRPAHVIVPAGLDRGFGHPRPEILYYLHALSKSYPDDYQMQVHVLNWPVWFLDTPDNKVNFVMKNMAEPGADTAARTVLPKTAAYIFVVRLFNRYYRADPDATINPLLKWWETKWKKAVGTLVEKTQIKARYVAQAYASFESAWREIGQMTVKPSTPILYVMAESFNNKDDDNNIIYQVHTVLCTLAASSTTSGTTSGGSGTSGASAITNASSVSHSVSRAVSITHPVRAKSGGSNTFGPHERDEDAHAETLLRTRVIPYWLRPTTLNPDPKYQIGDIQLAYDLDVHDDDIEAGYIGHSVTTFAAFNADKNGDQSEIANSTRSKGGGDDASSDEKKENIGMVNKSVSRDTMRGVPSTKVSNSDHNLALRQAPEIASSPLMDIRRRDLPVTSNLFFLYGSDFGSVANDNTCARLYDGSFSQFATFLDSGCLQLEAGWTPPAAGSPLTFANLSSSDPWLASLHSNLIGKITNLQLQGCISGGNAQVTGAQVSVDIFNTKLIFASTAPDVTSFESRAMLKDYNLLSLPLTMPTVTSFNVMDILQECGMPLLDNVKGSVTLPGFESINVLKANLDTSEESRNSLSFKANCNNSTWLRLRFKLDITSLGSIFASAFPFLESFHLDSVYLICQKTSNCLTGSSKAVVQTRISLEADISIGNDADTLSCRLWVVFAPGSTDFILRFTQPYDLTMINRTLGKLVGLSDTSTLDVKSLIPGDIFEVQVQQVSIKLNNGSDGASPFSVQLLSINFELDIFSSAFLLGIHYSPTTKAATLTAKLWTELAPDKNDYSLLPYVEEYDVFYPAKVTPTGVVHFDQLTSSSVTLPPALGLNLGLTELGFSATKDASGVNATFIGTIQTGSQIPDAGAPTVDLTSLSLYCTYSKPVGANSASYDVTLSTRLYLVPRNFPDLPAAMVSISVELKDSPSGGQVWTVIGDATDLAFAALYECFDQDANDGVMDILENFAIPSLYLEWQHGPDQTNLIAQGSLAIGPFELDLRYDYTGKVKSDPKSVSIWNFDASLGSSSSEGSSLLDLLTTLGLSEDVTDSLKEDVPFLADIDIPPATPSADTDPPVVLHVSTTSTSSTIVWLQISITSTFGTLSFTYVQLQGPRVRPSDGSSAPTPLGFKRIIRVMLDKLPTIPNIPVIGQIDQPFDSIDYVWVGDTTLPKEAPANTPQGFTDSEMTAINSTIANEINKIPYRASKSTLQADSPGNADNSNRDPHVLLEGHHFILVSDKVVVLDHIFGAKSAPKPPIPQDKLTMVPKKSSAVANRKTPFIVEPGIVQRSVVVRDAPSPSPAAALQGDSGGTKGAMTKTIGPLTIQSIGLQCKDGFLYILIDATISLGPIALSLVGFGVGVSMHLNLNDLKNLSLDDFDMILSGMSVYFSAPPVQIAGVFIHETDPAFEAYKGGLAISILPYTLLAVGAYQHTFADDLKSVFVFGRLDGPLFTLEFAEISGVEVGFGYNYSLTSPNAADIPSFPLVQGVTADSNPMTTLTQFDKYNTVCKDSLWFAAGIKVDAFEILSVDAALIVQFGASSIKLAIVAIASASMPPKVPKREEAFLYVELGMVASIDILGGTFTVQGQLTPNSFILYPDCHLVGGFAMCYWFHGSPYAGDWVFTIGGYHPAFKAPDYYPVVPRLGINWNLSDCLTVLGEAFFAITPVACMGGGRLLIVFNCGPISAHYEAWASFLMNFKPFYFIADIGVSVGVSFNLDLWIIHIHIEVDLGANMHLQGPPFGGVVSVDLWIHSFDIYFGDQNGDPGPVDWPTFLEAVKQDRTTQASTVQKTSSSLAVVALQAGSANDLVKDSNKKSGDMWFVRAPTFVFRVECKVPIDDATYGDGIKSSSWKKDNPDATTKPIYARLMKNEGSVGSSLTVTISKIPEQVLLPPTLPSNPTAVSSSVTTVDEENQFQIQPIFSNLPNALWAKYSSDVDPVHAGNSIDNILSPTDPKNPTTTTHLTGLTLTSPLPRLPKFNIPEFNATDAMLEGVFADGTTSTVPRQNPLLPPNGSDERPNLPQRGSLQNIGRPAPRGNDPWGDITGSWRSADEGGMQSLADAWTGLMGWGVGAGTAATATAVPGIPTTDGGGAGTGTAPRFTPLLGKKPSKLLGGKGTGAFENYYAGCPFLVSV
ncbi:hypothetical protein MMC25_003439 [Agyrium rufum]|nr:hypothetical protein [Agyrium rufum]